MIEPMLEHPQFEYYKQRKLDIKGSAADRELVERFGLLRRKRFLKLERDRTLCVKLRSSSIES